MFKNVSSGMKGPGFVSESSLDYEQKADDRTRKAVELAKRSMSKSSEESEKELGLSDTKDIKAKYKIELRFDKGRTTNGPNLCGVTIWESGKRLHGGGDDKMYFCADVRPGSKDGCNGPISSDYIRGGVAHCPNCKAMINAQYLTDLRIYKLPTRKLAEQVEKIFRVLKSHADIYVKYDRSDVHYQAMVKAEGAAKARRHRGLHIYPLKNILKDTANGADIVNRFYVFLTS